MEKRIDPQVGEWVDQQMATAFQAGLDCDIDTQAGLDRLVRRRAAQRARRRLRRLGLSALGVGLALVAAVPPARVYAVRCVGACVTGGDRLGQFVLANLRSGERQLSVRHGERAVAPDFELERAQGGTVRLSEFRGKVVVLNFWATWCRPCDVEVPWFVEFQTRFRDEDFSVIGVSVDEDGWSAVRPYLARKGVNYPVALGNEAVERSYGGPESLPTTLIVDRQGRVAVTHVGLADKATYERDIRMVLDESR